MREFVTNIDEQIENRFTYHPPTPEQVIVYKTIRDTAKNFAYDLRDWCPTECHEFEQALTALETVVFWANAAIARHPLVVENALKERK